MTGFLAFSKKCLALVAGAALTATALPTQAEIIPLPGGDPLAATRRATATHIDRPCDPVRATRRLDRTIRFICPDGSAWVVFRERGFVPAIIPCATAQEIGLSCQQPKTQM